MYEDVLLDHYRSPRNARRLDHPTKTVHKNNPLCGDEIDMDILLENGAVKDIAHSTHGCVISTAAASILSEYVKGKTKEDLMKLNREAMIELLGIELGPNRIKCALLPLEALQALLIK